MASRPPVTKPAVTGLIQSSFYLQYIMIHSVELNIPPHKANDPPNTGALFFININPPNNLSYLGEYQQPLMK